MPKATDVKLAIDWSKEGGLVADIDNISKLMQRMEDENVTVLWRPLHEASGGWFWWGHPVRRPISGFG